MFDGHNAYATATANIRTKKPRPHVWANFDRISYMALPLPAVIQVVGFIGGEIHQRANHLEISDECVEFGHLFRVAVIVGDPD